MDEAHTCARPKGANNSQQQRYNLLKKLSDAGKQLVLLTATPHSGKPEEFQSLIGLLDPKFENYTLSTPKEREELSKYFVQRRRADIRQYLGNEVVFPERIRVDNDGYKYDRTYLELLDNVKEYVKQGVESAKTLDNRKQRYIYWDLLALMRGVMSSPDAGISMLRNKIEKNSDDSEVNIDDTDSQVYVFNDHLKDIINADDIVPDALESLSRSDKYKFNQFISVLENIKATDSDNKVKAALENVFFALDEKKNPIVFCQYIQTAEYVGRYIAEHLSQKRGYKDVAVEVITSRLADEERKMKIDALCEKPRHVLICTDCLSEGVNLQNGFEAVIHYDLPWNPNRVEQRNGRIDRFGQTSPEVLISTMRAGNNAIDDIVLNVLYRKQDEIRSQLGVYLPISDNDASVMESLMQKIISSKNNLSQPSLFDEEDFAVSDEEQDRRIKVLAENEKISHTYFAHNNKHFDPTRLTAVLEEAKKVIGGVDDTCDFVVRQLQFLGVSLHEDAQLCYSFNITDLPTHLKHYFKTTNQGTVKISFASPTPKGYTYIGRNHTFVEDLSRGVVNDSINGGNLAACRALVMSTEAVKVKTTVLLMRVRSVIRDKKNVSRELVGEEMIFLGYRGSIENHDFLTQDEAADIFLGAKASGNTDLLSQKQLFTKSLQWTYDIDTLRLHTDDIATERANNLVDAFTRYRTYVSSSDYQVVEPILPMDIIAAYVYLPKI